MIDFGIAEAMSTLSMEDNLASSGLLTAVVDRLECGLMACGPEGELLHANVSARRELRGASSLRLAGDRVACQGPAEDSWRTALSAAALGQMSSLVDLGTIDRPWMVAVMPLRVSPGGASGALVVMGRRSACSPLALEMLASRHGLTYAEGRVFQALIASRTAREIAEQHGVAIATVRTQIQSVRDKLGVRSIDALLLRAAQVPPVTTVQ
jgi:DNA-binding CsgD family transcriptional regulator